MDEQTVLEAIEVRLQRVDKLWEEFHIVDNNLIDNYPEVDSRAVEFEDEFFDTKALLLRSVRERQTTAPLPGSSLHQRDAIDPLLNQLFEQQRTFLGTVNTSSLLGDRTVHENLQLPKVSIEKFDGEYHNWPSFEDSYLSSIHNNDSISNVVKFKLLKNLLREGPSSLIKNLSETEANYEEAWQKLKRRYDKKKKILTSYITTFLDLPTSITGRSSDIRSLADKADELLIGIKTMGTAAEYRDGWIIQILLRKLDSDTRQNWSKESVNMDFPTINQFFDFLNTICDGLDDGANEVQTSKQKQNPFRQGFKFNSFKSQVHSLPSSSYSIICLCCKKPHPTHRCFKFRGMTIKARQEFIEQQNACINCLKQGHAYNKCNDPYSCRACNQRHHTLLHQYSANLSAITHQSTAVPSSTAVTLVTQPSSSSSAMSQSEFDPKTLNIEPQTLNNKHVTINNISANVNLNRDNCTIPCIAILPTAIVLIRDRSGNKSFANALLDSGSQSTFVSENLVQRLGLHRSNSSVTVSGLGDKNPSTTKGLVEIQVSSRKSTNHVVFQALILSKLVTIQPFDVSEISKSDQLSRLELADPNIGQKKVIDILFGSDVFFDLLNPEKVVISGKTHAQSTKFGWIIIAPQSLDITATISTITTGEEINRNLQRFWEIEEPPTELKMSPENQLCEDHFVNYAYSNRDGRYVVRLPFRDPRVLLGHSQTAAVRRLLNMERRFSRDVSFASEYRKFMQEYLALGHMEEISNSEINRSTSEHFYLPHHGVLKLESTTTKLRVVFDGSCKSASGYSLNDALLVGPTIQSDLVSLITRFRQHPLVFSADVEKMYRQVLVDRSDVDYQRIVWRDNPDEEIRHYRLLTVTYGTSSAPFLAVRSLHRIAEDNESTHPEAAKTIKTDFYIDDLLSGCETLELAEQRVRDLIAVLKGSGFILRKWKSNSVQLLETLPDQLKEPSILSFDDDTMTVKTLGLQWNPNRDVFSFKIILNESQTIITKRNLLSEMSKVFDPLGWLSPTIITMKVLFQKLWTLKSNWDDKLPTNVRDEWINIKTNLPALETIEIPRHLGISSKAKNIEIHGFCDASESAYAAVVYFRIVSRDDIVTTSIVIAKTKVAPIKQISLPRLELCGAVLLTKLLKFVSSTVGNEQTEMFAWTDSQIVLAWLSDLPRRWKTFVANRTSTIIDVVPRRYWGHVASKDNPADCATRGLHPTDLKEFKLWWSGPKWLSSPKSNWPSSEKETTTNLEERQFIVSAVVTEINGDSIVLNLLDRFSSYESVRRTIAYLFKFRDRELPFVSLLRRAELFIIKVVQQKHFSDEIRDLKRGHSISTRSRLKALSPFIDADEVLRVGGRLSNAETTYDAKHQIILPSHHKLTELILRQAHITYLHAGPTLLTSILRQKFWILDVRNAVRHFIFKCVVCHRQKQTTSSQLMGSLPRNRVTQARPFLTTGVDYAGPIQLKTKHGRGRVPTTKGYIAIFVCFAVKAIHLELVSDMTADAYIAALKRFVSRRGVPTEIVSDNGTNFVGAKKQLKSLFNFFQNENKILMSLFLSQNLIKFTFNPASAPHFGGLWESNIRSMKYHLKRVTGNTILTFEEMATLLTQIEALMNSRPLCPMTENADDFNYLTPGHFLIGNAPTTIPEPSLQHLPESRLSRWQNIQQRIQGFWKTWSLDYLHNLQTRPKWRTRQPNLQTGDVVLIKEDGIPPGKWALGRIIELHPGKDELVRVAKVKTASGEYLRPIVKLSRLPIDRDEEISC